jgi:hypothetical protein
MNTTKINHIFFHPTLHNYFQNVKLLMPITRLTIAVKTISST